MSNFKQLIESVLHESEKNTVFPKTVTELENQLQSHSGKKEIYHKDHKVWEGSGRQSNIALNHIADHLKIDNGNGLAVKDDHMKDIKVIHHKE